ncbi:MAG: D-aminoacyl-tRNA deacylase [candidate division FCPU426 bacterium]
MKAVVQRVAAAEVSVAQQKVAAIGRGMLVLAGIAADDQEGEISQLAKKIAGLRIFEDGEGKMNLDLGQIQGQVLAVPQFTLLGDVRRGRRPDFTRAAGPESGRKGFELFCRELEACGVSVKTGVFQAHMQVMLVNDGPVTILLDSKEFKNE